MKAHTTKKWPFQFRYLPYSDRVAHNSRRNFRSQIGNQSSLQSQDTAETQSRKDRSLRLSLWREFERQQNQLSSQKQLSLVKNFSESMFRAQLSCS